MIAASMLWSSSSTAVYSRTVNPVYIVQMPAPVRDGSKPVRLMEMVREIAFEELPTAFNALLRGSARDRYVVTL